MLSFSGCLFVKPRRATHGKAKNVKKVDFPRHNIYFFYNFNRVTGGLNKIPSHAAQLTMKNATHAGLDFIELVENYNTPLYRFAYSLAKNKEDAADLTQQTFYIWAAKGNSLRDAAKIKPWLFTTLYREFLRLRRRKVRIRNAEPENIAAAAPVTLPDMATVLDATDAAVRLRDVDEIYRAPLALFYLEDFSYKEIAAALDLPLGTVMSRLSRGKNQLKEILLKDRNKTAKAGSQ